MYAPFRIFGNGGCPHCERAAQFLMEAKLPVQFVTIGNDPVLLEGLRRIQGSDTVSTPCLVCLAENPVEIIIGFREADYVRVRDSYLARSSAVAGSVDSPAQQPVGSPAPVAQPEAPVGQAG